MRTGRAWFWAYGFSACRRKDETIEQGRPGSPISEAAIEDHPADVEQVLRLFRHQNDMTLRVAGTGTEAFDLLEKERFSCVLLDYCLPDINGLDALRRFLYLHGRRVNTVQSDLSHLDWKPGEG